MVAPQLMFVEPPPPKKKRTFLPSPPERSLAYCTKQAMNTGNLPSTVVQNALRPNIGRTRESEPVASSRETPGAMSITLSCHSLTIAEVIPRPQCYSHKREQVVHNVMSKRNTRNNPTKRCDVYHLLAGDQNTGILHALTSIYTLSATKVDERVSREDLHEASAAGANRQHNSSSATS